MICFVSPPTVPHAPSLSPSLCIYRARLSIVSTPLNDRRVSSTIATALLLPPRARSRSAGLYGDPSTHPGPPSWLQRLSTSRSSACGRSICMSVAGAAASLVPFFLGRAAPALRARARCCEWTHVHTRPRDLLPALPASVDSLRLLSLSLSPSLLCSAPRLSPRPQQPARRCNSCNERTHTRRTSRHLP